MKRRGNNMTHPLGKLYWTELEEEIRATRKCLENIPIDKLFDWKPHPKSMQMGYLATIVAEIPKWISNVVEKGVIDFATFEHTEIKTKDDFVRYFDKNIEYAKKVLQQVSDEELAKPFTLQNKGQVLFTSTKNDTVRSSINHMVHHRGQLTVYMRLNDIPVPAIYGPSADEKTF
jgi:uncharacterized damage-inducible protein DinB